MNYYYTDRQGNAAGPVGLNELRRLAGAGVIRHDTLVIAEGESAWRPYGNEQGNAPGAKPPAPPPPVPKWRFGAGAKGPVPDSGTAPRPSPLAVWSLVLGILSWFCFGPLTGIPAIICGHRARRDIPRSSGLLTGDNTALIGLILGYLGTIIYTGLAVFFLVLAPFSTLRRVASNTSAGERGPARPGPTTSAPVRNQSSFRTVENALAVTATPAVNPAERSLIMTPGVLQAVATAFVVTEDGYALTCAHAVRDAKTIQVHTLYDTPVLRGRDFPVTVVASDEENDLALLKVTGGTMSFLPLGETGAPESRPLTLLGWPLVYERRDRPIEYIPSLAMRTLKVKMTRENESASRLVLDRPLNPGFTGGPILQDNGDVVAMANLKWAGPGLRPGRACDSPALVAFLKSHGVQPVLGGGLARLDPAALYKRAESATLSLRITPNEPVTTPPAWAPPVPYVERTISTKASLPADIALSPDGSTVVVVSTDNSLHVIDVATGKLKHRLQGLRRLRHLAFSPDGEMLASLDEQDHSVSIWRTRTGQLWNKLEADAEDMRFSPNGKLLACRSMEPYPYWRKQGAPPPVAVRIYEVDSGKIVTALNPTRDGLIGQIVAAEFMPRSGRVITAGDYKRQSTGQKEQVHLWNPAAGQLLGYVPLRLMAQRLPEIDNGSGGRGRARGALAVSPDETRLAIRVFDNGPVRDTVWVYSLPEGEFLFDLQAEGKTLGFTADGRVLGVGGDHGEWLCVNSWRLFDTTTGTLLWLFNGEGFHPIHFNRDGRGFVEFSQKEFIRGVDTCTLRFWNLEGAARN